MPYRDVKIEVVILFNQETCEHEVHYLSDIAPNYGAIELWRGVKSGKYALFNQDAYYNETLLKRHNSGNMLSPWQPKERLIEIASVWRSYSWNPSDYIEICRTTLELNDVPIDEK